ncbi:hypothetical protein GCM10020295_77110 [Streptomyces cinereospinus]
MIKFMDPNGSYSPDRPAGGERSGGGADVGCGGRVRAGRGEGSRGLVADPGDQGAAQRERQRALRGHQGEQGERPFGRRGQGRPAGEPRTADRDDRARAPVGQPPGDGGPGEASRSRGS